MINETFEEKQRMMPNWVGLVFFLFTLMFGWMFIDEAFLPRTHHVNQEGSPIFFFIVFIFFLTLLWLFLRARLTLKISHEGIEVQFPPFKKRQLIKWSDVSEAGIHTVKGKRNRVGVHKSKRNIAYLTMASHQLRLTLNDGTTVALDTGKPEDLKLIIEKKVRASA